MRHDHHVFLIPGFFGFTNLGQLPYFAHVSSLVGVLMDKAGLDAEVVTVETRPTASLRNRAGRLAETIARVASEDDNPIHLIGHSSGGLDARLFLTPGVSLPVEGIDVEALAARVKTVVTVSTPHHGTPMASFFSGLLGQPLLKILSLTTMYAIRFGRVPLSVLTKLVGVFARLDDLVNLNRTVLDQIYDQLLADFAKREHREDLQDFFADVGADQGLVHQLAPDGMDLFNATTSDREGVHYGSVVTRGRAPGLGSTFAARLDPYAHATHALYGGLYALTSRGQSRRSGELRPGHREALSQFFGEVPTVKASDGVVPTLSQPWGDVVYAVSADHLDVIGHFDDPAREPPHYDWLSSASGFRYSGFRTLWEAVVEFIKSSV